MGTNYRFINDEVNKMMGSKPLITRSHGKITPMNCSNISG
jgi:hypothetical protein